MAVGVAVADVLVRVRWRWRALVAGALGLGLAVVTGTVVAGVVGDAERARDAFGEARRVLVAAHDLPAGAVLAEGDLVARTWPVGLLPAGALDAAEPAVGQVVVVPVPAGEVLVASRLAPAGLSPVAGLVSSGRRAVAVPAGSGLPPLAPGDHVDLVAAAGSLAPGTPARVVAEDALVVAVDEQGATVAVLADELGATALALADQVVVVALRGA